MTLDEAKKAMVKFVELKTTLRPAFVYPIMKAEEVKPGHWEGKPIAGYSTVRCSECGDVFTENSGKWNYCPNCGAYMGVEDETD